MKPVDGQDMKEGPYLIYREDNSKMLQGDYHDGKQSGEWTMWYDNGQKASVDHYKDPRAGRPARRLVHRRQNRRDGRVQGRQAGRRVEAMGPQQVSKTGKRSTRTAPRSNDG